MLLIIGPIHIDRLRIRSKIPDTAGADSSTNTAADALAGIGDIFPLAVPKINSAYSLLRAGLYAHPAVTAGTAGNAARQQLPEYRSDGTSGSTPYSGALPELQASSLSE